ncbi:hypothetical protein PG997_008332 [Apiospora hydei]|uniref:Uncharacterized protein n=1 Tax=Apiospora hydei TaxID=1337664 RepID=A0ABR1WAH5_9PEZI
MDGFGTEASNDVVNSGRACRLSLNPTKEPRKRPLELSTYSLCVPTSIATAPFALPGPKGIRKTHRPDGHHGGRANIPPVADPDRSDRRPGRALPVLLLAHARVPAATPRCRLRRPDPRGRRRAHTADVPQLDRRTILWDLQRTGGSISATTERVLSGRIETPPVTFQPPSPPRTPANAASATTRSQQQKPAIPKSTEPDLITRYNLQSRINDSPGSAENGGSVDAKGKAWSSNRDERQSALQRRRDEMIIAARRKMEAKIAAERAGAGSQ